MADHTDSIRLQLRRGVAGARQLLENIGISQPTLSRAIAAMGDEIVRFGAARSIQYGLRDSRFGRDDVPIYGVSAGGKVSALGRLIPVFPDGFAMRRADDEMLYSQALPWWLLDMRPQGFIGRAYAAKYADALSLPDRLSDWSDTNALRALMAYGHDVVGNLLLGDVARERFIHAPAPTPIPLPIKGEVYSFQALEAARGDVSGSSAGGEQPKFLSFAETANGPRHVLVKFSLADANASLNPVTERWRDLLLAEHHALETLSAAGASAARSCIVDHGGQRFLEVERFDRIGSMGRLGVFSLAAIEAEFVGDAAAPWPVITSRLASDGHITDDAAAAVELLYAFGTLIGNTDMHHWNLSFISEHGHPYDLAPAYDMLPMGFAPRSGGVLPDSLVSAGLRSYVRNDVWLKAIVLAADFLERLRLDSRFSARFQACIDALERHVEDARAKMQRLG